MVTSVFHKPRRVDGENAPLLQGEVRQPTVEEGFLRTVNGTLEHSVREQLKKVTAPTLLVTAAGDKVCDPKTASRRRATCPTVTSARS